MGLNQNITWQCWHLLSQDNTLHILSTKVNCHLSSNFLRAAALSLFGWHTPIYRHYSASHHCFKITCHAINPSSCQTGHSVKGPTQVSMAYVVKTVDLRDARIFAVWQLVMGLSSSCSNMLAMLISLGTLLLDFAMVSVSQYTAHVAEGLGHLIASRESFFKFLQIRTKDFHHAPLHGLPFFSEW